MKDKFRINIMMPLLLSVANVLLMTDYNKTISGKKNLKGIFSEFQHFTIITIVRD